MKTLLSFALFTLVSGAAHSAPVPLITCSGTEPFWGIQTEANGSLYFTNPFADEAKTYNQTTMQNAAGTSGLYAFQIEAKHTDGSNLKLNVIHEECSDGMSEILYTHTAMVDVNGTLLTGCCDIN